MLGLVITLLASASPALPALDATCADGPACEGDPVEKAEYATPAVIDCRWSLGSAALFGECDGTPDGAPHDAWYRVSRFPDDERRTVELRPARRDRRGVVVASCDQLPPRGVELRLAPSQPAAVCASPTLLPFDEARATPPAAVFQLPSRFGDPPDRPPRV
jgi:hypothetical protein